MTIRSNTAVALLMAVIAGTPPPALAWCAAMGGYPSFEEQARAEAQKRRVRVSQQNLTRLGYYRSAVDGDTGPATRAAITAFRADNKLPPGDDVDNQLESALERCVAARAAASAPTKGSRKPVDRSCCGSAAPDCDTKVARP